MKRLTTTVLLGLLLSSADVEASTSEGADTWARFEPPGQSFALFMPNQVEKKRRTTMTIVGRVKTDVWKSKMRGGRFSVSVTDLPILADWFTGDETLYKKATKKMMDELGARMLETDRIERGPFERVIHYRVDNGSSDMNATRRGRAFMAAHGDSIVVVNAIVSDDAKVGLNDFFLGLAVRGR